MDSSIPAPLHVDFRRGSKAMETLTTPTTMTNAIPTLEVSDIQATVLRPRPSPYRGEYLIVRVDDALQGREMLRRVIPHVAPADNWWAPTLPGWLAIAFTFQGLKALGVTNACSDRFPPGIRGGMAARASILNDIGNNAPSNWEYPFGTTDVHVALAVYANDEQSLETVLGRARESQQDLPKISVIYRLKFSELPGGRNPFGFKDGLHNPHLEGSRDDVHPGYGTAIKAGEFVMGYPDELGETATSPEPEVLRRNGTFLAFRKFHTRVAAFRKYLREQASSPEEEELIAAKMVGRWRSGAPLVLAPTSDDPSLGADLDCNNAFNYEEDGAERGGVFLLIGAHLKQQFEFVQSQWVTNGDFINQGTEQDPMIGNGQVDRTFTIPNSQSVAAFMDCHNSLTCAEANTASCRVSEH